MLSLSGQELGDSGDQQGKGGPVQEDHATRLRPKEQRNETSTLGPDTGNHMATRLVLIQIRYIQMSNIVKFYICCSDLNVFNTEWFQDLRSTNSMLIAQNPWNS